MQVELWSKCISRSIPILCAFISAHAHAEPSRVNSTTAGELFVEPPTLISIGYEWKIEGDDNRNASVAVLFREKGANEWRTGLPPLRLQHEAIKNPPFDVVTPNMFAGSVFDLEPNTEYQVKLQFKDPDGVRGKNERIFSVRTRAEPQPATTGRIYHVYPPDYKGSKLEPAF
ncbi:MAG TPA: hypothetical protein VET48_14350, partial [Steroidobacteraceae bacterium]|nr:hypothetical protein [Steroidobacteraceae bacterium]